MFGEKNIVGMLFLPGFTLKRGFWGQKQRKIADFAKKKVENVL